MISIKLDCCLFVLIHHIVNTYAPIFPKMKSYCLSFNNHTFGNNRTPKASHFYLGCRKIRKMAFIKILLHFLKGLSLQRCGVSVV